MNTENLYPIADKIAKQCYNRWKKDYTMNAQSYEDLRQEAHLYMWKAIEKYKEKLPDADLKFIAMRAVYLRMKALLAKAIKYEKMFTKIETLLASNEYVNEEEFLDFLIQDHFSQRPSLGWMQLKEVCNNREYKVLDCIINQGLNYEDTGNKTGLSKQRISQMYKNLKKTIKKYLTNVYYPSILDRMKADS